MNRENLMLAGLKLLGVYLIMAGLAMFAEDVALILDKKYLQLVWPNFPFLSPSQSNHLELIYASIHVIAGILLSRQTEKCLPFLWPEKYRSAE